MTNTPEMPLLNLVTARLLVNEPTSSVQNAMATLIAPTLAVTPDHVLQPFDFGTPRRDIRVRLQFDARTDIPMEVEATVIARDPQVDFAILQLKSGFSNKLPAEVLSVETPPRGASWESYIQTPTTPTGVVVNGTIIGLEMYDDREHLHLAAPHPSERGSSGAPIIVNDRVVGIMARGGEKDGDWYAIPVTAMLKSQITPNLKSLLAGTLPIQNEAQNSTDDASLYQRLSPSSRRAFNHADGLRIALERDSVHMEHLLAGLFEKTDGPTQRVLAQVGIDKEKLHQLLEEEAERDFPRSDQYTPSALTTFPPLSAHAREALLAAQTVAMAHNTTQIQSRHLIYGALSITHCGMIKRLLDLKVDKDKIDLTPDQTAQSTTGKMAGYQIAGYQSDGPADKDLLGITREVQALCAVLAAQDVKPPLSLGLFGEWGSGKSSFMRQMELQINANRKDAQADPASPYCRDIVQLWFNAWHYIDTELWASLAQKIFDGLKESLAVQAFPNQPEALEYERAKRLTESLKAKEELAAAQKTAQKTETEVKQNEAQLTALAKGEDTLKISLLDVLDEVARLKKEPSENKEKDKDKDKEKKEEIAKKIENAATALSADEEKIKEQLVDVQGFWQQLRAFWLALQHVKNRHLWLLLFFLVVIGAVGGRLLWGWLQSRYAVALAISASLVPLAPFFVAAHRAARFVNDAIKSSRQMKEKALQTRRSELQQQLQEQQQTVTEKTQAVKTAEDGLENLRADKQIASFVKQRSASTDYAQYRGVIARVRDDFDQLSKLLATEREQRETAALSDDDALLPRIDRIILYIDDLDRCPENKVVEVLQAVHLLLAFPLFIVVVGVDPRWLLHSLKQHSAAFQANATEDDGLSDEESTHWQSTPLNYLEKIFQIPFTLRPMAETGFQELIENLAAAPPTKAPPLSVSQPELVVTPEKPAPPEPDRKSEPEPTRPTADITEPVKPTPPPPDPSPVEPAPLPPPEILNPEYLRIEAWEREVMKQLYGLIPSPRAAKRFVNIYRLLRVSVAADKRAAFISEDNPEQHRAALLLLAMLIGYPSETTDILRKLRACQSDKKWWDFVATLKPDKPGTGNVPGSPQAAEEKYWQELKKKLDHEDVRALIPAEQSCQHFIAWANEVARYSFQSGRVLLG